MAGPDATLDAPLGAGGERLHEWVFALEAELLDEIQIHLVPVLLGAGVRLVVAHLPTGPASLECTGTIESSTGVRHLKVPLGEMTSRS